MKAHAVQNRVGTSLVGILVLALISSACSASSGAAVGPQNKGPETISSTGIGPASQEIEATNRGYITVNLEVTDEGYKPSFFSLPAQRQVMLVLRNRGQHEHHLHIAGMIPANMLWLSKEPSEADPSHHGDAAEHYAYHQGGNLVPYHVCTSGVCPTENTIHLHAVPGDMDTVIFTPTSRGTFEITCPLHPDMKATATVF